MAVIKMREAVWALILAGAVFNDIALPTYRKRTYETPDEDGRIIRLEFDYRIFIFSGNKRGVIFLKSCVEEMYKAGLDLYTEGVLDPIHVIHKSGIFSDPEDQAY